MEYRLVITEHAEELLDNLIYYLLYKLKNEQAAKHLLNGVENVYERMETNPQQFAISRDSYLASKNYREALIPQMDYVIDRKSTRLNSSHTDISRMPSSA